MCPQRVVCLGLLGAAALLAGCAYLTGPSQGYPASSAALKTAMAQMKADPKGVARPVVVIDGWLPAGGSETMQRELIAMTGAGKERFVKHKYLPGFSTLESNARKIIEKVEQRWPSLDPEWTVEVDAVGYSMGGLIGRVAALPPGPGAKPRKRLRLRTLYSISAPHRGVNWWMGWFFLDEMSYKTSLYAGEARQQLDAAQRTAGYELICYGQGNDWLTGGKDAPEGYEVLRARGLLLMSHETSSGNRRHLADIAARLRGEAPLVNLPGDPR